MVRTARNRLGLRPAGKSADARGEECGGVIALEESARKLGLLAGAPGVDLVLLIEGKDVVQSGSELLDLGKFRHMNGDALDQLVSAEAENALVTLQTMLEPRQVIM